MSDHAATSGPRAGQGLATPQLQSEITDYESPYLTVTRALKRMPSGSEATFYLRRESDVAVCLPLTTGGGLITDLDAGLSCLDWMRTHSVDCG